MIKDWRQAKFERAMLILSVLQDYKTRLDRQNTVKRIDYPKHISKRYFQIKFNVSYIKLYVGRLEIDYIKLWQIISNIFKIFPTRDLQDIF